MRICIVTLHRARNCGAYLQARALGEKIKQLGHEVVYLRPAATRLRHYTKQTFFSFLSPFKRRSLTTFHLNLRFNLRYFGDKRHFPEVRDGENIDRFVLGSDVIWQLRSNPSGEHLNRFFGLGFPGEKVFSYAPSANGSLPEIFQSNEQIVHSLRRMRDISVRDESTRRIVSAVTGRPVSLVCDPVFLHGPDFYRSIQRPCKHRDFILVYAFGMKDFSNERIREIREYAQAQGKKIISFGVARKWCDLSVPYNSLAMPAYFDAADYVVTNTFHGTVFSILYGKQFAGLTTAKAKVNDLLSQFGLEERISAPGGSIAEILNRPIDRDGVRRRVEDLRESSIEYLSRNLR